MSSTSFFDVRKLHECSPRDFLSQCTEYLMGDRTRTIFTPNPEILLLARRDPKLTEALNRADLLLPDGFGVTLIAWLKHHKYLHRLPGIEAAEVLLREAVSIRAPVAILGGKNDNASTAVRKLRARFVGLRIAAFGEDVCYTKTGVACTEENDRRVNDALAAYAPQIVLVGLGAPKQEFWIMRHRNDFPSIHIMMAVGGAFDVWSGRLRRAPKPLRAVGLEWLWRLLQEPKRLPRIVRAIMIFPYHAIRNKKHYG